MPIEAAIVREHPCGAVGHDRRTLNLVQGMATGRSQVVNGFPNLPSAVDRIGGADPVAFGHRRERPDMIVGTP